MRFYNNSHPYYCGIDLHTRLLYVCLLDSQANVIVHKEIAANKDDLLLMIESYIGNVCWRRMHALLVLGHDRTQSKKRQKLRAQYRYVHP